MAKGLRHVGEKKPELFRYSQFVRSAIWQAKCHLAGSGMLAF